MRRPRYSSERHRAVTTVVTCRSLQTSSIGVEVNWTRTRDRTSHCDAGSSRSIISPCLWEADEPNRDGDAGLDSLKARWSITSGEETDQTTSELKIMEGEFFPLLM